MKRPIDLRLVHGIAGSTADFDPLRAHLPRDWHPEAVALPGHGGADGLRDGDDVRRIADLMATTMRPSTPTTVLIGHSTGGVLVLDAVSRGVLAAAAVVLIDPNVPLGAVAREQQRIKAAQAGCADWWRFFLASTATSIGEQAAPATRAAIEAGLHRVPRGDIATIWRAVLSYDATVAWVACPCPVLYLRTTRTIWPEEVAAVRARPGASTAPVEIVTLPSTLGHYPHLTAPDRVADAVVTFLRDHVPWASVDPALSGDTRSR